MVITRKRGEKFLIGKDIRVVILEVEAGKVRVGIDAPDDTLILREELVREGQQFQGDKRST